MSILTKLGITKESIAKLLGVHQTVEPTPTVRPKLGRPKGRNIDQSIVNAVRKAPKSYTIRELANRYSVSEYWVWSVRNNKTRVK